MKVKKILAGLLSAVLMCGAAPITYAADSSSDSIFESGFENGEGVSEFTGRGGAEVIEAVSGDSHTGDYSMCVSGREKSWNGPQILLDNRCDAGTEYIVSAWVKTSWYNNVNLSMEYTDSEGTRHYSNLQSAVSQGDWVEITETKFSFSDDVTNVYLYFECSDQADIYVDDFVLKKAPVLEIQQDIDSLKDLTSSFKVGTAVTASELASQTRQSLIKKQFNSITLGNELKPDAILDRDASIAAGNDDPQVNLASARSILNFCRDNNISVRGHVLVWHSQTPDWFFKENYADDGDWVDKETMLKRMENYIKNVFAAIEEEYPTVDFYAWDVVNECFLDNGSARNPGEQGSSGSDNSAWVQVFGDNSFIEYAFEYARKYAPEGCKLYYNDFNEYMPQKTAAIVEMATKLQEKGLIDGIGMQSHLDVSFPSVAVYKKALAAFAATGLDVQITELDITTSDTSESGLATQAEMYGQIMDAIMEYQDSVSAVVFWGTTDDASWRSSRLPLLFDADYVAKSAFYEVAESISENTTTEAPTTEPTTEAPTTEPATEAPTTETATEAPTTEPTTEAPTTEPTTEAPTTEPATEAPTTAETISPELVYGDADQSGEVTINDAVKIMSYVGNSAKYPMSAESIEASDVYSRGDGIDNMDALAVQKYCAQVVESLPESYAD